MKVIRSANPSLPIVRITEAAMRSVGSDIHADLEGINELLRTDLGLQSEKPPSFFLYGRARKTAVRGFHYPFSNTAHIQVPASATMRRTNGYSIRRGLTQTFVHEASHLVDSMDNGRRTLFETAARTAWNLGAFAVGAEAAQYAGGSGGIALGIGASLLTNRLFYDYLDQGEVRAREVHHDTALVDKYRNIIRLVDCPLV